MEKTSNTGLEFLPYKFTAKELDKETGLYYYGARYLDPKYSRWISTDPALGEYIPQAPTDEEAKRHNQNLPGMGGVFNTVNASLYHYAGNNPVRYIDPDGNFLLDSESAKEYAQYNSKSIAATYGQACVLVNYMNKLFPQPVDVVKNSSPFFSPYIFKFSDDKNLQTALTSIEKDKDNIFISYNIQASINKISKDVYQIDITVVGYIKDPLSGKVNIFTTGSGTVGYAHIQEIQGFKSIDNEKVGNIINKSLQAADLTIKMGNKE